MLESCGLAVHNQWGTMWGSERFTHSLGGLDVGDCANMAGYTRPSTQPETFLYTSLPHNYTIFESVKSRLVHIIHRAYKDISNLKKG